jgi:hypothetical protein
VSSAVLLYLTSADSTPIGKIAIADRDTFIFNNDDFQQNVLTNDWMHIALTIEIATYDKTCFFIRCVTISEIPPDPFQDLSPPLKHISVMGVNSAQYNTLYYINGDPITDHIMTHSQNTDIAIIFGTNLTLSPIQGKFDEVPKSILEKFDD